MTPPTKPDDKYRIEKKFSSDLKSSIDQMNNTSDHLEATLSGAETYLKALHVLTDGIHSPPNDIAMLNRIENTSQRSLDNLREISKENKRYLGNLNQRLGPDGGNETPRLPNIEDE